GAGAEMPHRAAQQDRAAAARDHRLISGNKVFDQFVIEQIVRRLRQRDYADLAIDVVAHCHGGSPSFRRNRTLASGPACSPPALPRDGQPVGAWPLVVRAYWPREKE